MTKDDAILLAVANSRGLCVLTEAEADEMRVALARESMAVRETLAIDDVHRAACAVAGTDPKTLAHQAFGDLLDTLGHASRRQQDVAKLLEEQRRELAERAPQDQAMPLKYTLRRSPGKTEGTMVPGATGQPS